MRTNGQRLKQVLTNLLSNAIKFTSKGKVILRADRAHGGWNPDHVVLDNAPEVVVFAVSDSGIGIPQSKQRLIFEAFQQADAGTARRYGGTGLGLAISRELAKLLGGELTVRSRPGAGSTFVLYLPSLHESALAAPLVHNPAPPPTVGTANPTLLVIEDDPVFARTLQDLATERGFDTLVAGSGEEGFRLAQRYRPDAITLDLELPDVDGWTVADRLHADAQTRDIAVHVISVRDRPQAAARHGVHSYTTKPADLISLAAVFAEVTSHMASPVHALLLIGEDPDKRAAIRMVLDGDGRIVDTVSDADEALAALHSRPYHGIVIDVDLPGTDGLALLDTIRHDRALASIPAVLYSEHALDEASLARAEQLQAAVIGEAGGEQSQAAAVDQFLRRVMSALLGEARPHDAVDALNGRHVLIVDDDARNLFALTGLLENCGMQVSATENGGEALRRLAEDDSIEIVLMDIMMPDMDGYETIRRLRTEPRLAHIPVIALTAKAMAEDRAKCLAAGASDYVSKPVNTDQLLAQLVHWLPVRPLNAPDTM